MKLSGFIILRFSGNALSVRMQIQNIGEVYNNFLTAQL